MCGNVKHDEHGNHIEEVEPVASPEEAPINVTEEFAIPVEVPAPAEAA